MEKEFVSYDRALRLKALGFNETCISFYSKGGKHNYDVQSPCTNIGSWNDQEYYCSAPTFSQAFEWMREKYGLHQSIIKYSGSKIYWCQIEMISDKKDRSGEYEVIYATSLSTFTKYRDAEIACLKKLLEIVEQKEK